MALEHTNLIGLEFSVTDVVVVVKIGVEVLRAIIRRVEDNNEAVVGFAFICISAQLVNISPVLTANLLIEI